jgi:hypothetical protein
MEFVDMLMFVIIFVAAYLIIRNPPEFLRKLFRPAKDDFQAQYVCPKCGSTDWKFANPLKPSPSMVNAPGFAQSMTECMKCGFVGVFFLKDKRDKIELKPKAQAPIRRTFKYYLIDRILQIVLAIVFTIGLFFLFSRVVG